MTDNLYVAGNFYDGGHRQGIGLYVQHKALIIFSPHEEEKIHRSYHNLCTDPHHCKDCAIHDYQFEVENKNPLLIDEGLRKEILDPGTTDLRLIEILTTLHSGVNVPDS